MGESIISEVDNGGWIRTAYYAEIQFLIKLTGLILINSGCMLLDGWCRAQMYSIEIR